MRGEESFSDIIHRLIKEHKEPKKKITNPERYEEEEAIEKEVSIILDEVETIINVPPESIEEKKEA